MLKIEVLLLILILILFSSCNKNKRTGDFKVTGNIVLAHNQQGVPDVNVYVGDENTFNPGGPQSYSPLHTPVGTDANGQFTIEFTTDEEVCPHFVITDEEMMKLYRIKGNDFYYSSRYYAVKELENNQENILVELQKLGKFRLEIKKNSSINTDSIHMKQTGHTLSTLFTIQNDTNLFFITEPDRQTTFEIRRKDSLLWSTTLYFGEAGDTLSSILQL